jgi:hypothetical protein
MYEESDNLEEGFILNDEFDLEDGEVVPGLDLEEDKLEDPEDNFH